MLLAGARRPPGAADDTVPRGVLLDYEKDFSCTSLECLGYGTLAPGHHTTARPGDRIDLGEGVVARVMAVNGQVVGGARVKVHDAAGRWVALLLTDGACRCLTAGALPGGGEGTADVELPLAQAVGHVDVLRVSAGGADTSTSAAFLRAVSPAVAIVSTGPGGCGPSQAVLGAAGGERRPVWASPAGPARGVAARSCTSRPRSPWLGARCRCAPTAVATPSRPLPSTSAPTAQQSPGTAGTAPASPRPAPAPLISRRRTGFVSAGEPVSCSLTDPDRATAQFVAESDTGLMQDFSREFYRLGHPCAAIRLNRVGQLLQALAGRSTGARRETWPGSSPSRSAPSTGIWRSSSRWASRWSRTGRGGAR